MVEAISRRRTICIMAAAAGLPLMPFAASARTGIDPFVWKGQALGAPAMLVLNHPDRAAAERLTSRVVSEIDRLETIFSLYRDFSVLNELNRAGGLAAPPKELVELLDACRAAWEVSDGAFDPTIQPLWALYARHFASPGADPAGPPAAALEEARKRVGFDAVRFNGDRIAFTRPGMALTLNGIAQGYVTDRVVALLRAEGITSSLVSMGESRAIGAKADGSPWRIGLAETEHGINPDAVIDLVDRAVATSSMSGFHFDPAGRFGHIMVPDARFSPPGYRRVSVIAADATTADAFSTAVTLMPLAKIRSLVDRNPSLAVDMVLADRETVRIGTVDRSSPGLPSQSL